MPTKKIDKSDIEDVYKKLGLLDEDERRKMMFADRLRGITYGSKIRIKEDTITTPKSKSSQNA